MEKTCIQCGKTVTDKKKLVGDLCCRCYQIVWKNHPEQLLKNNRSQVKTCIKCNVIDKKDCFHGKYCKKCYRQKWTSEFRTKNGLPDPKKKDVVNKVCKNCQFEGNKSLFVGRRCGACLNMMKKKQYHIYTKLSLSNKICKDCGLENVKSLFVGFRCKTCHTKAKKENSRKSYEKNKEKNKNKHMISRQKYQKKNRKKISAASKLKRQRDPILRFKNNISRLVNLELRKTGSSKNGSSCFNYFGYTISELKDHIETQFTLPGNEWMNWNNQGRYIVSAWKDNDKSTWKWQLDHIIPQSKFPCTSMEDENFRKCWALSNLQLLPAKDNILKSDNVKE